MSHDMIAKLAAQAAANEDQTEVVQGGDFEYTPPPAGLTIGRLVEYIEMGKQKQKPFKGQAKPDADVVWIGFELLHPKKNIHEIEVEGEGKKNVADFIRLKLTKKLGEKAKFKKLFNALQYGRADMKHIAQMLGNAYKIEVYHNETEVEGQKRIYVNLDKDGAYGITAPFVVDPLTEERKDIPVPANIRPLRIFLWDFPNKETWDSLFIDGTRTIKVDGKDVEQSKNYIQEMIKNATNYQGSALHQMLSEVPELDVGGSEATKGKAETNSTTKSPSEDALAELDKVSKTDTKQDDLAALGL